MNDVRARLADAIGDRYQLEREVGAGGMATVYLAEDLRHHRKVALKVFRPELAAVLGSARFLSEISVTANLQHPHILGLIDSGEAAGLLYYVMPYVDGETLRARLVREKQLPIADAVRITQEVASALDYAHRHGVIHRDVKPENILLHDGQALVADFGIALAVSAAGGHRMTETGMSLGTPQYMSPEQAMGEREITARSDVYALGAVTYEMLVGDPPFTGSTAQAIIAKVVTSTPDPPRAHRTTIPAHVDAAVLTALQKLPADRFATAAQFAAALSDSAYATSASAQPTSAPPGPWKRIAIGSGIIAFAALSLAAWSLRGVPPAAPVLRYGLALPDSERLNDQRGQRVALSPDGLVLAYTGPGSEGPGLWIRPRNALHALRNPGTTGVSQPFFSPDGKRIGYLNGVVLRTIEVGGSTPTTVVDSGIGLDGGTWAEDGYIYLDGLTAGGVTGLVRVRPDGTGFQGVTTVDTARGEVDHVWPQALPGGRGILFTVQRRGGTAASDVAVLDLKTGKYHIVVRGVTARYSPSGHLLHVTADGELLVSRFDLGRLELRGKAQRLNTGVRIRAFGAVDLAISRGGTLLYGAGSNEAPETRLVWVNDKGAEELVDPGMTGDFRTLTVSPDGRRLAVSIRSATDQHIWIKLVPHGPLTKLSFEGTNSVRPQFSPDGRRVIYVATIGGPSRLHSRQVDNAGNYTTVLAFPRRPVSDGRLNRTGDWLVYETNPNQVFARRTSGDTASTPVDAPDRETFQATLSPDGRWIAYVSNASGRSEVYVRSFPIAGDTRWQVSASGGSTPAWAPGNAALYYRSAADSLVMVPFRPGDPPTLGAPRALFSTRPYVSGGRSWDVAPDGRFLFIRFTRRDDRQPDELVVVENAVAEFE